MTKLKQVFALILFFALLLAAVGCGKKDDDAEPEVKLTAADVLDKMVEATDNTNSRQCESRCDMVFAMSATANGANVSFEIKMDIDCEVVVSKDPFAGYTYGDISMSMMGEEQSTVVTLYVVEEDGELISYTNDGSGWVRDYATKENRERMSNGTSFHYLTELDEDELTLEEGTEKINGKDTYVLHCEIPGSRLQDMGFDPSSMIDVYADAYTYPTILYIDAETFLPVHAEIDISKTVDALKDSLLESMDSAPDDLVVTTTCDGYLVDFTYDVPAPEVPAEATR